MKKRILIFAGGKLSKSFLKEIKKADFVIGVDRGAYWLIINNVIPNIALGDFDSVTKKEFAVIEQKAKKVKTFPKEKNWTDLELAVDEAIGFKPEEIIVFGGMGGRADHTLGAFYLLEKILNAGIPHALLDANNRISLIGIGRTILERGGEKYVSILPHSKKISVSLQGFRYNLPKTDITQGFTVGISNEISDASAVIEIFAGKAWVIRSRD